MHAVLKWRTHVRDASNYKRPRENEHADTVRPEKAAANISSLVLKRECRSKLTTSTYYFSTQDLSTTSSWEPLLEAKIFKVLDRRLPDQKKKKKKEGGVSKALKPNKSPTQDQSPKDVLAG